MTKHIHEEQQNQISGGGELTGKPKMTTFFPCKHKEDTPRIPGQHTIRRWKAVAGEAAVAYAEDVLERRGGELGGDALVPGPRLLQRHAGRRRDDVGPHRREPPRRAGPGSSAVITATAT